MKRFLLIITGLLMALTLWSKTTITIELKTSGSLLDLLTNTQIEQTEKIIITGNRLDAKDFNVLKKMLVQHRLEDINIENTATATIPERAFEGCHNLKRIKLPQYLLDTGWYAFLDCSNLEEIKLPFSVQIINNSFRGCSSLNSIVLGRNIQKVGAQSFYLCNNLKEVHCTSTTPPQCEYSSFDGLYENCILYVPTGYKKSYTYSDGWLFFDNIREEDIEPSYSLDVNLHNGRFAYQIYPGYNGEWVSVVSWIYPRIDCAIKVGKGETVILHIEPQTDYYIEKYIECVLLDGVDITSQLTGANTNVLYIAINKNSQLDIYVKEKNSTPNEIIDNKVINVFRTINTIVVENVKIGERINVYSASGVLMYSKKTDNTICNIPVTDNPIYFVKIGAKVYKLIK